MENVVKIQHCDLTIVLENKESFDRHYIKQNIQMQAAETLHLFSYDR